MKIVYIDSNPASATAFFSAVRVTNRTVECKVVVNRTGAVSYVLDDSNTPHYIFVHCRFKDIPCHTLIAFIRKQDHLNNTKIIVIADYLTRKDLDRFDMLKVDGYVKFRKDLTIFLDDILRARL